MQSTGHLDWVSVTFPTNTRFSYLLPEGAKPQHYAEIGPGRHGYLKQWKGDSGALIMSDGKIEQGVHLVLTGETLESIRASGPTDKALCGNFERQHGKASRIDVAIDVYDSPLSIDDLIVAYRTGLLQTPAKAASRIENLNTPEQTLYVGQRASNRLFRAYNKGAQVQDERAWIRLELECKRLTARAVVQAIVNNTDTRAVINRTIKDFANFPTNPTYVAALRQHDALIPPVPRRITKTYRWLMEICAPALARYELENPDDSVFDAFLTSYAIANKRMAKQRSQDTP